MLEAKTIAEINHIFATLDITSPNLQSFSEMISNAVVLGVPKDRLVVDMSIVRGLDYYTGSVFETFIPGAEKYGSICSGGRYDDLASAFSKRRFPGVGISFGLSRLLSVLLDKGYVKPGRKTATQVLVTMQDRDKHFEDYLALARSIRLAGIPTEVFMERNPLRDQIGYAAAKGIRVAVIASDAEFDRVMAIVRDLEHRTESVVQGDELGDEIKRILST